MECPRTSAAHWSLAAISPYEGYVRVSYEDPDIPPFRALSGHAGDEIRAIEDFRYKAQIPSPAAAVRELLRRGLASDKEEEEGVT